MHQVVVAPATLSTKFIETGKIPKFLIYDLAGVAILQGIPRHNSVVQSLKRRTITGLAAAFLLSFLLVIVFSPHFHDSHAGLRQNESAAVGSLRKIYDLQSKYAAAHPNEGFAHVR